MSKCINTAPVVVCFTETATGAKTSLLEHVVYEKGVAIGQVFTTAADTETPFDISGGTVVAGACPVFTPDIEIDDFCDILADGTRVPFLRRTIINFDANGTVVDPMIVNDFELDGVTAYTVAGTVEDDCGCKPIGSLGTITDWADLA